MNTISGILASFRRFPIADIMTVLGGERALILAPHPDDESLGCGGLIAAACSAGIAPIVVILTDGAASHPESSSFPPVRLRGLREAEVRTATSLLGLPPENLRLLGHADTKLPSVGNEFCQIVDYLVQLAAMEFCGLIIGPWIGDPHCDHEAAAYIADAVAKAADLRLMSYPVWGWLRQPTDMVDERRENGWRLNITAHAVVKKQAIASHRSQHGDLIRDSRNAFQLPENLLMIFEQPFEVFIK